MHTCACKTFEFKNWNGWRVSSCHCFTYRQLSSLAIIEQDDKMTMIANSKIHLVSRRNITLSFHSPCGLCLFHFHFSMPYLPKWNDLRYYFILHMWLSLQKPSLMAHLVFWEIPFWNIEATAVLLCRLLVMLDLQYN